MPWWQGGGGHPLAIAAEGDLQYGVGSGGVEWRWAAGARACTTGRISMHQQWAPGAKAPGGAAPAAAPPPPKQAGARQAPHLRQLALLPPQGAGVSTQQTGKVQQRNLGAVAGAPLLACGGGHASGAGAVGREARGMASVDPPSAHAGPAAADCGESVLCPKGPWQWHRLHRRGDARRARAATGPPPKHKTKLSKIT